MENVEMTVENEMLTIKVDLSKRIGPSKSGKTIKIASTGPAIPIPGYTDQKVQVGLNVYLK